MRMLVPEEFATKWDGNVPSSSGRYLIVEIVETLIVGGAGSSQPRSKPQDKPKDKPQDGNQSKPKPKKEVAFDDGLDDDLDDDDLDNVKTPPKNPTVRQTKPPPRSCKLSPSNDCVILVTIDGINLVRQFKTSEAAVKSLKIVSDTFDNPTFTDKAIAIKMGSSGLWYLPNGKPFTVA